MEPLQKVRAEAAKGAGNKSFGVAINVIAKQPNRSSPAGQCVGDTEFAIAVEQRTRGAHQYFPERAQARWPT